MSYEICVVKDKRHFFSTDTRSITDRAKLCDVLLIFSLKFTKEEGYEILVSERQETGSYFTEDGLKELGLTIRNLTWPQKAQRKMIDFEEATPKQALEKAFDVEGTDIRYHDGWVLLYARAYAIMNSEDPDKDWQKYEDPAEEYAKKTGSRGGTPDTGFYEFMKKAIDGG